MTSNGCSCRLPYSQARCAPGEANQQTPGQEIREQSQEAPTVPELGLHSDWANVPLLRDQGEAGLTRPGPQEEGS